MGCKQSNERKKSNQPVHHLRSQSFRQQAVPMGSPQNSAPNKPMTLQPFTMNEDGSTESAPSPASPGSPGNMTYTAIKLAELTSCMRCHKTFEVPSELAQHLDVCHPKPCETCGELIFPSMESCCPVKLHQLFRIKSSNAVRQETTSEINAKFTEKEDIAAAHIQRMWRKYRSRSRYEEAAFLTILIELDRNRENLVVGRLSSDSFHKPQRRRSVVTSKCTRSDIPDGHYFPVSRDERITPSITDKIAEDLGHLNRIPYAAVWRILEDAVEHLFNLKNIVQVTTPEKGKIVVVGDLHGQIDDLHHILSLNGHPSKEVYYVFNGDFVDRGSSGMEIVIMLFSLLVAHPKYVFLVRGNHEVSYMNEEYGFDMEVATKYDREMYHFVQRVFNHLPLGVIINKSTFVVHGGVPRREGTTLLDINAIERKRQIPFPGPDQSEEDELFQDLLWSDPMPQPGILPNDRGVGIFFGPDVSKAFMETNNLKLIIRSHEVCDGGYEEHHGGRVCTVFSASDYDGAQTNRGCIAIFKHGVDRPTFFSYRNEDIEHSDFTFTNASEVFSPLAEEVPTSKTEVLRYIRGRVFDNRHRLITVFNALDTNQTGYIYRDEWVQTMKMVIAPNIPWHYLSQYLLSTANQHGNKVQYIHFLHKYYTKLMQKWVENWQHRVAHKFAIAIHKKNITLKVGHFGRGATENTVVSFSEVLASFRRFHTGLSDHEIFQLYSFFDNNSNGYVKVGDIIDIVEAHSEKGLAVSPRHVKDAGKMWELDVMQEMQHLFMSGKVSLLHCFRSMDLEHNGKLSMENFQKGMTVVSRALAVPLEPWQITTLYSCVDMDGDGIISFKDFMEAFTIQEHTF